MQELYLIRFNCYGWDSWEVYTEDKALFDVVSQFRMSDELQKTLGPEKWEELVETYTSVKYPYVCLGETELLQPN